MFKLPPTAWILGYQRLFAYELPKYRHAPSTGWLRGRQNSNRSLPRIFGYPKHNSTRSALTCAWPSLE